MSLGLHTTQDITNVQWLGATKILFGDRLVTANPPDIGAGKMIIALAIFVPGSTSLPSARRFKGGHILTWGMSPTGPPDSDANIRIPRPSFLRLFGEGKCNIELNVVDKDLRQAVEPNDAVCELRVRSIESCLNRDCWNHILFSIDVSRVTTRVTGVFHTVWKATTTYNVEYQPEWVGSIHYTTMPPGPHTPVPPSGMLFYSDGSLWGRIYVYGSYTDTATNWGGMENGKIVKCWINGTKVALISDDEYYAVNDMFSEHPGAITNGPDGAPMVIPTTGGPFELLGSSRAPISGPSDDGIKFAAVQIWFGKLVDGPDLFVADDKGDKVLRRPDVAQEALDRSDVLLDGYPFTFVKNKGNEALAFTPSNMEHFLPVKYPRELG